MPNVSKESIELNMFSIRKRCGCHALLNAVAPTAAVACTLTHARLVAQSYISPDASSSHFFFSLLMRVEHQIRAYFNLGSDLQRLSITLQRCYMWVTSLSRAMSNNNIFFCLFIVFAVLLCHSSADFLHLPNCNGLRRHVR